MEDRQSIADLMTGWIHRDLAEWDKLSDLFHPGGGNKAIAETNAVVIAENVHLDLGVSAHARFYDRVEKRGGAWKIAKRQGIYDFAYFNFPQGVVEIDRALVKKYPREYAALAYGLEERQSRALAVPDPPTDRHNVD